MSNHTVALKIEPKTPKVGTSEILSMVTIYLNLKTSGDILWEISWTQYRHRCRYRQRHWWNTKVTLYVSHQHNRWRHNFQSYSLYPNCTVVPPAWEITLFWGMVQANETLVIEKVSLSRASRAKQQAIVYR